MISNLAFLLVVFTSDGAASRAVKGSRKVFGNTHWCDRMYIKHSERSDSKGGGDSSVVRAPDS